MSYDTTKTDVVGTVYDPVDTEYVWAEDWNAFVAAFKTHAARHQNAGVDEINVDGLSGLLADAQTPLSHTHAESGVTGLVTDLAGKAAVVHTHAESDVTSLVSDLSGKAATAHMHAESDTTNLVTDLASKAAATHNHAATDINSATLDGDRLPAMSATKKGAVPATGTPTGLFLRDDGSFTSVGTLGGSTGGTDNAVLRADGTSGATLQNSLAAIDDSGSVNIPSNQQYKVAGSQHVHVQADITSIDHGLLAGLTDDDHVRYFDKDCSKALTGSSLKRDTNASGIDIYGGDGTAGSGGILATWGKDNPGMSAGFGFFVPNAAKNANLTAMLLLGETDNPYLDMNTHKIVSVLDPTNAQDAATKNYVDTTTFALDGSRALTGSLLKRDINTSYLGFVGGTSLSGKGAVIKLYGDDAGGPSGAVYIGVPNAAKNSYNDVITILGCTDTPFLSLNSLQIKSVADPTAAQDAATKNYVDTVIAVATENYTPVYGTTSSATFIPAVADKKIKVHSVQSIVVSGSTVNISGTFGGSSTTIFVVGSTGSTSFSSSTPDVLADTNTAVTLTIVGANTYVCASYKYIDA
jgi:hypothetical protein